MLTVCKTIRVLSQNIDKQEWPSCLYFTHDGVFQHCKQWNYWCLNSKSPNRDTWVSLKRYGLFEFKHNFTSSFIFHDNRIYLRLYSKLLVYDDALVCDLIFLFDNGVVYTNTGKTFTSRSAKIDGVSEEKVESSNTTNSDNTINIMMGMNIPLFSMRV